MLVSLHLPKTAGTSFRASLQEQYHSKLLQDYTDFPINTPVYERNKAALQASLCNAEKDFLEIECIHGHFLPLKYLLLAKQRKVTFVTWMRNPVERMLSHYYFWKKTLNPEKSPPLHKKMIEENWSLEQFCLAPELKNIYSQFLFGFPLDNFSFIGITEFYNEDFKFFANNYLNIEAKPKKMNVGSKSAYSISQSARNNIEAFHEKDMVLYQNVLNIRVNRNKI